MIRTSFNHGWEFRPKVNPFAELAGVRVPYQPVTLPHDAMLAQQRSETGTPATAYFPGGTYEYRKTFTVPAAGEGDRILIEFEGVYRDAVVYVNGVYAGQRPYGYSPFRVDATALLRYGADNEIRVEARSHQDSRWYTGAGIYRDTWLLTGGPVRIAPGSLHVTTPQVDADRAVVEVAVTVGNDTTLLRTTHLTVDVRDAAGHVVATAATPVSVRPGEPATARLRLYVADPRLWGPDTPTLYTTTATLGDGDTDTTTFGIRTLSLDPHRGLRVNGTTVKLRGACVHHDNGLLGAVSTARAEHRRIQRLKDAGFNAVRVSHQPAARAMLDACDRIGMLVIDEAFDMWTSGKTEFDYHLNFAEWWERDIEAMVTNDRNHPSVIMYSIGNEIPEAGSPAGAVQGRALAERIRALDPTRYVTNGVNNMLAVMADLAAMRAQQEQDGGGINTAMAGNAGDMMNAIAGSDLVTQRTAESYALLDVAGMNYSEARYPLDAGLFPNRIILGTETFPTRIADLWAQVLRHDHVIGDFTWTGWDYLGEVGIGRPQYHDPDAVPAFNGPYPYLLAGTGDIDILGDRRPASYYREIVFGLRSLPYLAVRRPQHFGKTFSGTPWAWSDAIASWTWPGSEGQPATVEVYSAGDEAELLVDGESTGRRGLVEHRTAFDVVYQPGELVAVAYEKGVEIGRHRLRTATGPLSLRAVAEQTAVAVGGGDLAYVALTLTDAGGVVHTAADRPITVEVTGDGELIGLGSADPCTAERFDATTRTSYEGRVLAVLRPTGPGKIRLLATAPGCDPAEVLIAVDETPSR
ncbi:glycoside hydrolase family 2 TIM barrel-domain containing protein [Actinoplanes sp. NPDC051851]|uniref:glycoside hydrolase family 2 TIM barrel-domain containing protein n=1 Tax=Actinoplanes sp. NPDC051851 TaxID=3154753 RepID=UPI00344643C6